MTQQKRIVLDPNNVPLVDLVATYYVGTLNIHRFLSHHVAPILPRSLDNPHDSALLNLFARMVLHVGTLAYLHEPHHFQTIAATARALFELVLDLNLVDLREEDLLDKFRNYPLVEQYRSAEQFVQHVGRRMPQEELIKTSQYRLSNDLDRRESVRKTIARVWRLPVEPQIKYPRHWTGLSVLQRARKCGLKYVGFYDAWFAQLSWYLHSGIVGFQGQPEDLLNSAFCTYSDLSQ